ncbi:MAG: protein-tyrosine phosphatase family protein, partial [Gammaproteobacteria bacterium]
LGDARALCQGLNEQLEQQAAVVFHCRAGLGRTGTLMACMLVYRGESASRAIERIRIINSGYVQSEDQYQFVHAFERSGASRAVAAGGLNVSSSTAIHSPRM